MMLTIIFLFVLIFIVRAEDRQLGSVQKIETVLFLCRMNLQFSTIAVRMHFFMSYMRICAYFDVRFMSIGVEFVLGTKRNLVI